MKLLLVNVISAAAGKCVNKDLAGGMGTGTWVGESLCARIFEYVKKTSVVVPEVTSAYIMAIFKRAGWETEYREMKNAEDATRSVADLVLVATSIVDCHHELEIVKALKSNGLTVGAYGTFASAVPDFFLGAADFVVCGEPEAAAARLANGERPQGKFAVQQIENLETLPYPDWSLFSIEKYSYFPALHKKPVLTMLASRGCPHSCFFYCPYPICAGRAWRARSPANVAGEMEYLKKEYGVRAIDFRDPIFTLDKKRAAEIANLLIEKNLGIIWSCETRLDCLDKDLLKLLYRAGLRNLNIGVESSDAAVLKSSNRLPIQIQHQEEMIAACKELGISVAAFYILGLEDDDEATILNTMKYARKLNTLIAQFTVSTPYPGTAFYEKIKSENKFTKDRWEDFDAYTPVYRHKNLTAEQLLRLKELAFVSYYFRPAYFWRHCASLIKKKILWLF
jgi:radical SAM superfamily enzyme YgiQ (UPF0313 family)